MAMRAYYEDYVGHAQKIMGDMFDFAVNTCDMEPDGFFTKFIVTGTAGQFEIGNPRYIAGMTGCEIVREIMNQSGISLEGIEDVMYLDKTPEYWAGWALCYYQWYSAKTFVKIHEAISMAEIIDMYPMMHEMDIMNFVESMEEKLEAFYQVTNLKRLRMNRGLSQKELAQASQVPIRQIQLFEQKQRDINKAQVTSVVKLAKALYCNVEDLLEI